MSVATVALVAAGCGNGEKNDYVDEVNAIQTDVQTQANDLLAQGADISKPQQAVQLVEDLQQIFVDAAADLEAVEPPEDVADLHAQLVEEIGSVGDQIGGVTDAFQSGNPQQIQQAASDLQSAISGSQTELSSLIDQINSTLQG
jgi:hypothetical protein